MFFSQGRIKHLELYPYNNILLRKKKKEPLRHIKTLMECQMHFDKLVAKDKNTV